MKLKRNASVFEISAHEFHRYLRRIMRDPEVISETRNSLMDAQAKKFKAIAKSASVMVVVAIAAVSLSEGAYASIKTAMFDLKVPKIYLIFVASVTWYIFIVHCLQVSVLMSADMSANELIKRRSIPFRQPEIALRGLDHYDVLSAFRHGHLFKQAKNFLHLYNSIFFLIYFFALLPIFPALYSMIIISIDSLSSCADVFAHSWIAAANLALIFGSLVIAVLFFWRAPIEKSIDFIRWNFLISITQNSELENNVERWLTESDP